MARKRAEWEKGKRNRMPGKRKRQSPRSEIGAQVGQSGRRREDAGPAARPDARPAQPFRVRGQEGSARGGP